MILACTATSGWGHSYRARQIGLPLCTLICGIQVGLRVLRCLIY